MSFLEGVAMRLIPRRLNGRLRPHDTWFKLQRWPTGHWHIQVPGWFCEYSPSGPVRFVIDKRPMPWANRGLSAAEAKRFNIGNRPLLRL